jgi:hypothetical protein
MTTQPAPGDGGDLIPPTDPALDRRVAALLAAAPDLTAQQLAAATQEPMDAVARTAAWRRAQRGGSAESVGPSAAADA